VVQFTCFSFAFVCSRFVFFLSPVVSLRRMSTPRRPGRPPSRHSSTAPKMCTHELHETLWPDIPRLQSGEFFYSHSTKCKKCYIFMQQDRQRRARNGELPARVLPRRGAVGQRPARRSAAVQRCVDFVYVSVAFLPVLFFVVFISSFSSSEKRLRRRYLACPF
jgi:hypothetical protein